MQTSGKTEAPMLIPNAPIEGAEPNRRSEWYQEAYIRGMQDGVQVKTGALDETKLAAKMSGALEKKARELGKKQGEEAAKTIVEAKDISGTVASKEDRMATLEDETIALDRSSSAYQAFASIFDEAFIEAFWKKRDFGIGEFRGIIIVYFDKCSYLNLY